MDCRLDLEAASMRMAALMRKFNLALLQNDLIECRRVNISMKCEAEFIETTLVTAMKPRTLRAQNGR